MVGFFLQIFFRGGFQENQHFFILDRHGSHITIQTLEQIIEVGLEWSPYLLIFHMHYNHWMSLTSNHSKQLLRKKENLPWQKTIILNQTKLH